MIADAVDHQDALGQLLSPEYAAKLAQLGIEKAAEYRSAKPFAYGVFDDFLPLAVAEAALRDFPEPKQIK